MHTSANKARTTQPPINFAISPGRPNLAALIENLRVTKTAAETACTALSAAEEKHRRPDGKLARPARPKVYGGMTEPMAIEIAGKRTDNPSREWFFTSREQIEKEGTPEQLSDWDRQEKANARAYPSEIRKAERAQHKALDTWTTAEWAFVDYRPQSIAEAAELLALAGAPHKRGGLFLEVGEEGLTLIARNCAKALSDLVN